jgi:hypothetical protein
VGSNYLSLRPGSVVQLLQLWVQLISISVLALMVVHDAATTLTDVSRYLQPLPPELSHPLQQQNVLQRRER